MRAHSRVTQAKVSRWVLVPAMNSASRIYHTVDYEGFVPFNFGGLRDQICTSYGPKVDCVRQVDF